MRGKNRREKDFFSARIFRKRENVHMEMAPMYLYATDFFARENAAKIAYMEKRPKWSTYDCENGQGVFAELHCPAKTEQKLALGAFIIVI